MGCGDLDTKNYDEATQKSNICSFNYGLALLNSISSTYNTNMFEIIDIANEVALLKIRSRALSIIQDTTTSMGLYIRSIALSSELQEKIDSNNYLIGNAKKYNFLKYIPWQNQTTGYYTAVPMNNYLTYGAAISYLENLADNINNYESWGFSFTIGSGGEFEIGGDTYATLINLTLTGANEIGIIDDETYEKITMSPLWQMGLTAVASMGVSYGMSQMGFTKTPLGTYMDNATYAEMFTSDVMDVFDTVNLVSSLYDAYTTYKEYRDLEDTTEDIQSAPKQIKEYVDTDIYASGDYYKFFAGQKLFNAAMAGHENYVPASAQIPSWGIVKDNLHSEDSFISMIMNQNRNATMAGGAGYLNYITEGVLKNKI